MDKSFGYGDTTLTLGFFGLGKSNLSLMETLPHGTHIVLRSDKAIDRAKIPKNITPQKIYEGKSALDDISEDVLILSPSVRRDRPELAAAQERGVILTSDCELFFERANAQVLGVSGSSGKSTTATLSHLALGGDVHGIKLVGNVGVPMLNSISEGATGYVAELSSFMLEYYTPKLRRYALTNITPNHLDFHGTFEKYKEAKLRPLHLCDEGIICADDDVLSKERYESLFGVYSIRHDIRELATKYRAELYLTLEGGYICRNGERLLHTDTLKRRDGYMLQNMMCSMALVDGIAKRDTMLSAMRGFSNLAHRCDTVYSVGGVDFIDSSIDTTPERCATTLTSLGRRVVLLLGGRGKGLSYGVMLPPVLKYVRFAVLFGEEGEKFFSLLTGKIGCVVCKNFKEAVKLAMSVAEPGDAVLLSPACTSYDEFSSFEERGETFRSIVRSL